MFLLYIIICILLVIFFVSLISARYGSLARTILLTFVCKIQGNPVKFLRSDSELCRKVLVASDYKGKVPAMSPLYNIESVDGDLWRKLSLGFKSVLPITNFSERLPDIVKKHVKKILEETNIVDSKCIQKITINIFFELLFQKEISKDDETLFVNASNEWRLEIAQKGKGNMVLKDAMIERVSVFLESSNFKVDEISKKFNLQKYELLSIFMQPFLISPCINVSDIMAETFLLIKKNINVKNDIVLAARNNDYQYLLSAIFETIRINHPFPVFERELTKDLKHKKTIYKKGTHFFIEMDCFENSKVYDPRRWIDNKNFEDISWIPFGAGARICAGHLVARKLLQHLIHELIIEKNFQIEKIQPWVNHTISGRINDKSAATKKEVFYQIQRFSYVFFSLIAQRIQKTVFKKMK